MSDPADPGTLLEFYTIDQDSPWRRAPGCDILGVRRGGPAGEGPTGGEDGRPERALRFLASGDGSVLMNLGGLATLGRYRPPNLTHVVFDNGSLLSTGGFVSHTASGRTDLAAVARAAGCPRVLEAHTVFQFMEAVAEAFAADEMTTIVAKAEAVGPDLFHMDLALPENAFRFKRAALTTPEAPRGG